MLFQTANGNGSMPGSNRPRGLSTCVSFTDLRTSQTSLARVSASNGVRKFRSELEMADIGGNGSNEDDVGSVRKIETTFIQ